MSKTKKAITTNKNGNVKLTPLPVTPAAELIGGLAPLPVPAVGEGVKTRDVGPPLPSVTDDLAVPVVIASF